MRKYFRSFPVSIVLPLNSTPHTLHHNFQTAPVPDSFYHTRMAELSEPDRDAITGYPSLQLSRLRERLQRVESGWKSNGSTLDALNLDPQQAISTLIESLKEHPVASRLHISASGPLLASELAKILIQLEEPNEGTRGHLRLRPLSPAVRTHHLQVTRLCHLAKCS